MSIRLSRNFPAPRNKLSSYCYLASYTTRTSASDDVHRASPNLLTIRQHSPSLVPLPWPLPLPLPSPCSSCDAYTCQRVQIVDMHTTKLIYQCLLSTLSLQLLYNVASWRLQLPSVNRLLSATPFFRKPAWRLYHFDNNTSYHEHFMTLALKQAHLAAQRGEVPVGAAVVKVESTVRQEYDNNNGIGNSSRNSTGGIKVYASVISLSHNLVEARTDASAHAELFAMKRAAKVLNNWRLTNCTLYTTLEPCPLCLSACLAFRVDRIVYGAPDHRLGAVESYIRLLDSPHPFHKPQEVISGVCADECGNVMRQFFRARRSKKKAKDTP
jgi:tRNA(adenine34) deaminase